MTATATTRRKSTTHDAPCHKQSHADAPFFLGGGSNEHPTAADILPPNTTNQSPRSEETVPTTGTATDEVVKRYGTTKKHRDQLPHHVQEPRAASEPARERTTTSTTPKKHQTTTKHNDSHDNPKGHKETHAGTQNTCTPFKNHGHTP